MKKNLFTWIIVLAAVMICAYFLPAQVQAEPATFTNGNFTYTVSPTTYNAHIVDFDDSFSGDVVIPSRLDGYLVEGIGYDAFDDCTNITSITIPDSIKSIGVEAFRNCPNLTGYWVDENNSYYSSDLYGVLFDKNKTTILEVPKGITGAYTIPENITEIDDSVFYKCTKLTQITIPNTVTRIGYSAFGSTGLTEVRIPESVTVIEGETFNYCENLTSVTIPESITEIRLGAFANCSKLTSITIPDSVTTIGAEIFSNCEKLTDVKLSANITTIPLNTFYACRSLSSITLPAGVTSIGQHAFYLCTELTNINIPDRVTDIGPYAFRSCEKLSSITIPSGVTGISKGAFDYCSKLWHVLYKGTEAQWNAIAMGADNGYLTQAIRHYNCTGNEITNLANKQCHACFVANCTHSYDNACDTDCNICETPRTITHNYQASWSKDKTNHWHECSVCGEKKDLAVHTPGAAATETAPQTCTICGYIIKPALNHTHKYAETLSSDRDGHWYACGGCSEQKDYAAHVYANACDTDCDRCGYTRSVAHSYKTDWSKDNAGHWIVCSVCKDKKDFAAHTPGAAATETASQTCTICGYIIKPALNHTHSFAATWSTDEDGHWHNCPGCEEKDSYAQHSWDNGLCAVCGATDPNATQPTTPPAASTDGKQDTGCKYIPWIILILILIVAIILFVLEKKKKFLSGIFARISKKSE